MLPKKWEAVFLDIKHHQLEHFQEKWVPVFRPENAAYKKEHFQEKCLGTACPDT